MRGIELHCGGGERTRTADFHVANVALYQLSYTPWREAQGSAGSGAIRWDLAFEGLLEPRLKHRRRQIPARPLEHRPQRVGGAA